MSSDQTEQEQKIEALEIFSHRILEELGETKRGDWLDEYKNDSDYVRAAGISLLDLQSAVERSDRSEIRKQVALTVASLLAVYDRNNVEE